MELDYILAYVSLMTLLALTVSLIGLPSPRLNIDDLLTAVGVSASHPGSRIRVIAYIPRGSSIFFQDRKIIINSMGFSNILVDMSLASRKGNVLFLDFEVSNVRLYSGYYVLELSSVPGKVSIVVVDYLKS